MRSPGQALTWAVCFLMRSALELDSSTIPVITMRPVELLESPSETPTWHLMSLCADTSYSPDLWFDDADAARRVCAHCPVRNDCLTYAMDVEVDTGIQLIGVWGGLSPIQRKRLRSHPDRLERMRRVRSRTKLRLVVSSPRQEIPAQTKLVARPEQLSLVLD